MRHSLARRWSVALLFLLVAALIAGCSSGSSQGSGTPTPPVTGSVPPGQVPGGGSLGSAKGIYQFTGQKNPANASLPYLAGASLNFYWSDIEPAKGQFNWGLIDGDMQPWVSHGKHVILRISTAGNNMGGSSAQRTPQWVFDEGVPHVTLSSGAVYPQYWNATWQAEFTAFIQAFAARYDGNAAITYIDAAVGNDGETIPIKDTSPEALPLMQGIGYTDALWYSTIQRIVGIYKAAFHHTPLALQPDRTFIGGTPGYSESMVLSWAVGQGLWLQNDGLNPSTSLSGPWTQTTLAVEQVSPASQRGVSITDDLTAAMNQHASFVLIFASDINKTGNQSALRSAAPQIAG